MLDVRNLQTGCVSCASGSPSSLSPSLAVAAHPAPNAGYLPHYMRGVHHDVEGIDKGAD